MAEPKTFQFLDGVRYICHPDHRNGTPAKSQWHIGEDDEHQCFANSRQRGWIDLVVGWGLHLLDNAPAYLGVAQDHQTRLFIAKFIGGGSAGWHGFPADHCRSTDRPNDRVLGLWLRDEVLPAPKVRKIQKGQPCKL